MGFVHAITYVINPPGSNSQLLDWYGPGAEDLHIVELDLDDPRVVPFIAAHPFGTVFHHPAWLRTLSTEYNRGIVVLGCESQNGHLAGIFPLMRTRGVPMSLFGEPAKARLSSLPRTPIAGPLCANQEASRLLVSAAIDLASQEGGVRLQIKTEGPLLDGIVDDVSGVPWRKSFVLPLPEDPRKLRIGSSGARRKHIRSNVKRAESLGVRVRFADTEADIRRWYGIYLRTMRRVIVPPRSLRCFLAMWKYMAPLGLMKVMLAERQREGRTEMIAGSIFLMHGRKVFYAFSACPSEYFPLQPNDLIHWKAIHWAAKSGYREYHLGEVPNDAHHLAAYKSKWGGEERLLYRYYYPRMITESQDCSEISRRQKLLEKIWQHVPLPVTAYLGDLIYSYL
jgi:hypothetical protein